VGFVLWQINFLIHRLPGGVGDLAAKEEAHPLYEASKAIDRATKDATGPRKNRRS
jgi:hypothetical protein